MISLECGGLTPLFGRKHRLDIAASLHTLALLEALNYSEAAPPVIALIEVDEAEATPIVQRQGAAACLRKPFGADELATSIDKVCASALPEQTANV
jgi:AmiR/NasT family two-component response regulator